MAQEVKSHFVLSAQLWTIVGAALPRGNSGLNNVGSALKSCETERFAAGAGMGGYPCVVLRVMVCCFGSQAA